MTTATTFSQHIAAMNEHELRRLLLEQHSRQKMGLYWEHSAIERDKALNADVVLPRLVPALSHPGSGAPYQNLVIEGDNFDSLRLLRATHTGKVRVIYIDPPYNTGNKDWVYNDRFVGANDRWRHSQWLEFLYQRLVLARDLLTPDGVILVSINDENRARLELLMDEVFRGRRVGSFVWRTRTGGNDAKGAFFSDNHEHVMVYGNSEFKFSGDEKSYSIYKHEEAGRVFYLSDLTKAHDYKVRPNTYYPVYDPACDIWYPCNPGRVWAYASKSRVKKDQRLRGDTMEEMIEQGQVWFPPDQTVAIFETMDDLLAAIDAKNIPFSGNTPLLSRDTQNLDEWVGRQIGFGRPRLKKFKDGLKNESQPISSWLTPRQEQATVDPLSNMLVVGTTEEGSRILKDLMGDKAFPYPKPLSLIQGLLAQASRPGDTVLDFFAGSGTTGHAVMALNALDGGQRRFILCSSTEATAKEPTKNLCRDVCAARIKKVIESDDAFTSTSFAYLQLDKLDAADLRLDATHDNALQLLGLRHARGAVATQAGCLQIVHADADLAVVYLPEASQAAVEALRALPQPRLAVYSTRPKTVTECLEGSDKDVTAYAIGDALALGQGAGA